ncbi:MAG: hypothetical protein ACLRTI_00260 [Blautia sp.]
MIKILSWSAEGSGQNFLKIFNDIQADIVCIQDLALSEAQFIGFNPTGYISYWNWKEKNKEVGTAIFTKLKPLTSEWGISYKLDKEGRSLTLEYPEFYLINVFTPLKQGNYDPVRLEWDIVFFDYVQRLMEKKQVVICGNMNVAYGDYSETTCTDSEQSEISSLLKLGMMDTYRCRFPRKGESLLRLDYCLMSDTLRQKLVSSTVYNVGPVSEIVHKPIDVVFDIEDLNVVPVTAAIPLPLLYWVNAMPKPLDFDKEDDDEQNCCLCEKKN